MIRIFAAIGLCMLLVGCGTTAPITTPIVQTRVFVPSLPNSVFHCDGNVVYPNPDTLTDQQIGDLLTNLDIRLRTCAVNAASGKSTWLRLKAEAEAANAVIEQ